MNCNRERERERESKVSVSNVRPRLTGAAHICAGQIAAEIQSHQLEEQHAKNEISNIKCAVILVTATDREHLKQRKVWHTGRLSQNKILMLLDIHTGNKYKNIIVILL